MATSTNSFSSFSARGGEMEQLHLILKKNGLILLPTDTIWCIAGDATDGLAVERLLRLKSAGKDYVPEILVSSITMLKSFAPDLHPRLETLLYHHVRPLSIRTPGTNRLSRKLVDKEGFSIFRVAQDFFCRELIEAYGKPLVVAAACVGNDGFPATFGAIRSDILRRVDTVVRYRQNEKAPGSPSVLVFMNAKMELEFLRE